MTLLLATFSPATTKYSPGSRSPSHRSFLHPFSWLQEEENARVGEFFKSSGDNTMSRSPAMGVFDCPCCFPTQGKWVLIEGLVNPRKVPGADGQQWRTSWKMVMGREGEWGDGEEISCWEVVRGEASYRPIRGENQEAALGLQTTVSVGCQRELCWASTSEAWWSIIE